MTDRYTPAQIYSLAIGATLLLIGILGFLVDSAFDTGTNINGETLIGFEVNGWHNLVHILSGLVGLTLWRNPATARNFALGFGAVYAVVTLWGLIDGNNVLGLIPVNAADNVLHLLIAAAGIAAGLASRAVRHDARDRDPGAARTAA